MYTKVHWPRRRKRRKRGNNFGSFQLLDFACASREFFSPLGNLCGALLTIPLIFPRIPFACSNYENVLFEAASVRWPYSLNWFNYAEQITVFRFTRWSKVEIQLRNADSEKKVTPICAFMLIREKSNVFLTKLINKLRGDGAIFHSIDHLCELGTWIKIKCIYFKLDQWLTSQGNKIKAYLIKSKYLPIFCTLIGYL